MDHNHDRASLIQVEPPAAPLDEDGGLCCCEYIDRHNKRFHLLGSLCNCEDFDLFFTRLVTCRRVDPSTRSRMLLTFQDRLRIPWRGGAKQFSLETLVPFVAIPVLLGLAAINAYTATIIFLSSAVCIGYCFYFAQRNLVRTRFFSMWILWSVVYIFVLFQCTVPMLELLLEENIILCALATIAVFCLFRTKRRAILNQVEQSRVSKDELPDFTEATAAEEEEAAAIQTALLVDEIEEAVDVRQHQSNICTTCRKYMPPRTAHCSLCAACILRCDHHSYWLDCCIGYRNHLYYLTGLVFAELALLLCANLILTAVCHPFLVVRFLSIPLMLPDDCSEVFYEYKFGVSFIVAVYSLLMAGYIFVALLRQIYYISRGITMHENHRGQSANRKTYWNNCRGFFT